MKKKIVSGGLLAIAVTTAFINVYASGADAVSNAEKMEKGKPGILETKTIAEEGFIYGLPIVMNYARDGEFCDKNLDVTT